MTEQASELPPEAGARFLEQVFQFWLQPEIDRRRESELLPQGFQLVAAQVLFYPDGRSPLVRINEEVRALASVRAPKPLVPGEPVWTHQIDGFQCLELTETDANAGHVTLIRLRENWFMSFNFRYNTLCVRDTMKRASEFLEAARHSITNNNLHVGLDTLYSAVELLAKTWLLPTPFKLGKTHDSVRVPFNRHAHFGNTDVEFARLLNRLAQLRPKARYMDGKLNIGGDEAQAVLTKADEMFRAAELVAPRRALVD